MEREIIHYRSGSNLIKFLFFSTRTILTEDMKGAKMMETLSLVLLLLVVFLSPIIILLVRSTTNTIQVSWLNHLLKKKSDRNYFDTTELFNKFGGEDTPTESWEKSFRSIALADAAQQCHRTIEAAATSKYKLISNCANRETFIHPNHCVNFPFPHHYNLCWNH